MSTVLTAQATAPTNTTVSTTRRSVPARLNALAARQHTVAVVASIVGLGVANAVLTASYEASKFPVPFAEGQTTFSGPTIKGYYAELIAQGTMGRYVLTQLIDIGFIAAMMLFGVAAGTRLARSFGPSTRLGRAARLSGTAVAVGAGFDAIENLWSFAMLAQPTSFADWLAIPYSASAVIKFALEISGIIALGLLAVTLLGRTIVRFARR